MKYWIWLSLSLGFASENFKPLITKFLSPEKIYNTELGRLSSVCRLTPSEIKGLKNRSLTKAESIVKSCESGNIRIITYADGSYPERLRYISAPPVCLYCRGELPELNTLPSISIVGTRNADEYSFRAAWSLSARLSLANILIVSGGAVGIDTAAHKGCLDTGSKTVALLACGIKHTYLKKNKQLREAISKNGCLISEYPPQYPVTKSSFYERNRILSGISLGTVVIQAGEKSGALITAKYAAEQGRDVFVITGKPDDKNYSGSNMLLRDGAKPVFDIEDIISEYLHIYGNIIDTDKAKSFGLSKLYNSLYGRSPSDNSAAKITAESKKSPVSEKNISKNFNETLSKNAQIVYNYLDIDFFTVDDLYDTGLSVSDIFSAVTELELSGLIKAVPGGRYSKLKQGE